MDNPRVLLSDCVCLYRFRCDYMCDIECAVDACVGGVFVSAGALAFAFLFAFALALTASWAFQKRIVKTRCPGRSRKLSGRVPGSSWFLVRGFLQPSYIYIYIKIYTYIDKRISTKINELYSCGYV